jgi:hypothetical protein
VRERRVRSASDYRFNAREVRCSRTALSGNHRYPSEAHRASCQADAGPREIKSRRFGARGLLLSARRLVSAVPRSRRNQAFRAPHSVPRRRRVQSITGIPARAARPEWQCRGSATRCRRPDVARHLEMKRLEPAQTTSSIRMYPTCYANIGPAQSCEAEGFFSEYPISATHRF